jgi:hypothetical protein
MEVKQYVVLGPTVSVFRLRSKLQFGTLDLSWLLSHPYALRLYRNMKWQY